MKLNSLSEQFVLDAHRSQVHVKSPCPIKAQQISGTFMHDQLHMEHATSTVSHTNRVEHRNDKHTIDKIGLTRKHAAHLGLLQMQGYQKNERDLPQRSLSVSLHQEPRFYPHSHLLTAYATVLNLPTPEERREGGQRGSKEGEERRDAGQYLVHNSTQSFNYGKMHHRAIWGPRLRPYK